MEHTALASALQSHDWVGSRHVLERMLRLLPSEPSLRFTLGSVMRNQARTSTSAHPDMQPSRLLAQAEVSYRSALKIHPSYGDAAAERASLAVERYRLGDHDGPSHSCPDATESAETCVESLLRQAVALQPANAAVHRRLGSWFHERDAGSHTQLHAAAQALHTSVRLAPADAETQLLLALTQHRRGEGVAAARAYRRVIRIQPRHAEAYRLYGSLLHNSDALERADGVLRIACTLELDPALRGSVGSEWAHVLQLQGRLDEAAAASCAAAAATAGAGSRASSSASSASSAVAALAAGAVVSSELLPWRLPNELTLPMYIWRQRERLGRACCPGQERRSGREHQGHRIRNQSRLDPESPHAALFRSCRARRSLRVMLSRVSRHRFNPRARPVRIELSRPKAHAC